MYMYMLVPIHRKQKTLAPHIQSIASMEMYCQTKGIYPCYQCSAAMRNSSLNAWTLCASASSERTLQTLSFVAVCNEGGQVK